MTRTKQSGEPIYIVIAESLRNQIIDGIFNPGDMLPSENDLAEKFSTTRITVRKGLKSLESDGYIYSRPGKGYFVSTPEYKSFSIDFTEANETSRIRKIDLVTPNDEVAGALHLEADQKVLEISRIVTKNDLPVAYDLKYLPYDKGHPTIEREIQYAVFPEIVAAKTTPFAFYTTLSLTAESAKESLARELNCPVGVPLLVMRRFIISKDSFLGYGIRYMTGGFGPITGKSGVFKR